MRDKGMDLSERQLKMSVLINSMTALKTAGEQQGVTANLENLSNLLKSRLERNKSRILQMASVPAEKPIPVQQQEAPEIRGEFLKSQPDLKESSASLKNFISELILKSIQNKWSAKENLAAENPEQPEISIEERFQSVFANSNPFSPAELPAEIWSKIAAALPEGYQIPNPGTYRVIANSLEK